MRSFVDGGVEPESARLPDYPKGNDQLGGKAPYQRGEAREPQQTHQLRTQCAHTASQPASQRADTGRGRNKDTKELKSAQPERTFPRNTQASRVSGGICAQDFCLDWRDDSPARP